MTRHFALTIHLYDRRYHGAIEWPPAPARVFQALVAGAAQGRHLPDGARRALTLLEGLPAPVIAVPRARRGQRVAMFVPNNDLDAVGGDPDRVGEVRTKKAVQPHLLDGDALFYAWPLPEDGDSAGLNELADGLYQLGRGIDPAWAVGETLNDEQLAARLRVHRGSIHRPGRGDGGVDLACPTMSSLASITRRFEAALLRLRPSREGVTYFVQPPKAEFAMVRYGGAPTSQLFVLQREEKPGTSSPWAVWRAASLVESLRGVAVTALTEALPSRSDDVERVLVGRKRDGADAGPIKERVRFIPLPSIGHTHADVAIRRVVVEVPPGPLAEGDVLWALSGRQLFDPATGELGETTLAAADEDEMVKRYRGPSRVWRSVTPLALSAAPRRRISPERQREDVKSATERSGEERSAHAAIAQALRHAGLTTSLVRAHVQREPFSAHGTRAERFADGTRFPKETLWHAEIELNRAVDGPLVLGDGRFLGLGLMAPAVDPLPGIYSFTAVDGLSESAQPAEVTRALRRAVMARVQGALGRTPMPGFFSGHDVDGSPTRSPRSSHLAFVFDSARSRLLIVAPHVLDGRDPTPDERGHLAILDQALENFVELRAGSAGCLALRAAWLDPEIDPLTAGSSKWESVTPYLVTRHIKKADAAEAVSADLRAECRRRALPEPLEVRPFDVRGVQGVGLLASARLVFAVAVGGPILLGRSRYLGGGLFCGRDHRTSGVP